MPNFEFTSPIYLVFLAIYFITSSIKMFDIRLEQAKRGMMGREMRDIVLTEPPMPFWVIFLYWIDWLIAITLFVLNWKITIIVWIIRFILKVVPVLETFGNIFMRPFRPKFPAGVSELHLAAARDLKILNNTSTENKQVWESSIEKVRDTFAKLNCTTEDE